MDSLLPHYHVWNPHYQFLIEQEAQLSLRDRASALSVGLSLDLHSDIFSTSTTTTTTTTCEIDRCSIHLLDQSDIVLLWWKTANVNLAFLQNRAQPFTAMLIHSGTVAKSIGTKICTL